MDRLRSQVMMVPPASAKPEGKKLRRKLQKIGSQSPRSPTVCVESKKTSSFFIFRNKTEPQPVELEPAGTTPLSQHSLLPQHESNELDDGEWLEQFRRDGYLCRDDNPPQPIEDTRPTNVVPELAHLSQNDTRPDDQPDQAADYTPSNTPSTQRTLRRYAKTPVTRIGQLETPPPSEHATVRRISSIELIAESYRALLESRCSILREPSPEPWTQEDAWRPETADHYRPLQSPLETVAELPEPRALMCSPSSDDGTLVAFEEDTIYFKPISRPGTCDPPSPLRQVAHCESPSTPSSSQNSPTSNSPSLQISFDRLARELSSAVDGLSNYPGREKTSALQIWLMIEAYERLRDDVLGPRQPGPQLEALEPVFDMWLHALHQVHAKLTGDEGSLSEYASFDEESK
ncbi:hypothetical protein GGR56DRAFT_407856 [Xylariaceae sp. FL0804]|nr:hypothetical protein GGR56DRAFT_407856 [Xylariaceae sp. FL0804]